MQLTSDDAANLLKQHYDLSGRVQTLSAERDHNFKIELDAPHASPLVLKVYPVDEDDMAADMLATVLRFLANTEDALPVPRLRTTRNGAAFARFTDQDGHLRRMIAYTYLPGIPQFEAQRSSAQASACGKLLAQLARALEPFSHPHMHRMLIWDLRHLSRLRDFLISEARVPFANFVKSYLDLFEAEISARLDALPRQFVHNDLNARNVIVDPSRPSIVTGIIDFGDAVHTARIADLAIGVVGQFGELAQAQIGMDAFVDAYRSHTDLSDEERALLPVLVAGRIVQNVVMTAWYRASQPENGHFAGFDSHYFESRVAFAEELVGRWKKGYLHD